MIERLFLSGVDLFRLNFSHEAYEEKLALEQQIRTVEENRAPSSVAASSKPALNSLRDSFSASTLMPGPGNETRVHLLHPQILGALSVGSTLLLDDGKIWMRVVHETGAGADLLRYCKVPRVTEISFFGV